MHPVMAAALAPFAPPQSSVHRVPMPPHFVTTLGEKTAITVTYEYTPAESAVYDVESPVCGPGCAAEVEICEVLLNGEDIRDLLAQHVIDQLEEQAIERATP